MEKRLTHTHCPVCASTQIVTLFVCKDYTVSGEEFTIQQCQQCYTAFTQNAPTASTIGNYYQSENYISHSNTRKGLINKVYHVARGFMLKQKKALVEKITQKTNGKLLDIGCGTGYFLNQMQDTWQTIGIETDPKARSFAQNQFNLQVFPPEDLAQLTEKTFDVISLWHVLEHLHDLEQTWKSFDLLLKTDGVLFIAVPNYTSVDAQHYGAAWAAWDVPRHLWHFSPNSISFLAKKYNFEVVAQRTMPLDSFYVSLLTERYKGNPLALLSGFWQGFRSWLAALVVTNRSSSVIYILKRSTVKT